MTGTHGAGSSHHAVGAGLKPQLFQLHFSFGRASEGQIDQFRPANQHNRADKLTLTLVPERQSLWNAKSGTLTHFVCPRPPLWLPWGPVLRLGRGTDEPEPLRVRSSSGWSGPVVFHKHLRGQARQLVRSRNRSVYPLSACGVNPYCRRTLVAERLGHGSAEIVDRGRRTTAASDTIRGASLQESVDCRQLIYRPRKWAHFENASGSARQRAKPVRARPLALS